MAKSVLDEIAEAKEAIDAAKLKREVFRSKLEDLKTEAKKKHGAETIQDIEDLIADKQNRLTKVTAKVDRLREELKAVVKELI